MDSKAFEIAYNSYHVRLVYFAKSLIGGLYCDDIVADCFLKLWEMELGNDTNIKSLLYKMVLNKCRSVLKGKYKNYNPLKEYDEEQISDDYADALMIKSELINILVEKINNLTPAQRKVFDLFYLHGLKINEVCEILNISPDTARVHKMKLNKEFRIFGTPIFYRNCWWKGKSHGHKLVSKNSKLKPLIGGG